VRYVDASALLRSLFGEPGPAVPLTDGEKLVSSTIVEVEAFQAIHRARLTGNLDDERTAIKSKELVELLVTFDFVPVDDAVIGRAKQGFGVSVRAIDAIHVATAEILAAKADGDDLEFWTHDERQATAALSRGLTVRGIQLPAS